MFGSGEQAQWSVRAIADCHYKGQAEREPEEGENGMKPRDIRAGVR